MIKFDTRFAVGQVVRHRLFDYRGVIVSADPTFRLSEEWYEYMARSRPPKDRPWYHVLVDDTDQVTYVAERNLELDGSGESITHPMLAEFFDQFEDGFYSDSSSVN